MPLLVVADRLNSTLMGNRLIKKGLKEMCRQVIPVIEVLAISSLLL
jgi:hypothetical protein